VGVRDSRELHCWILADQLRQLVFQTTRRSSFASHLWLRSQLERSAASACSNIAEGFSRFNPNDFARFLAMSKGSLSEVLDHLDTAVGLGLMSTDERASMASLARRSRGAAAKLIRYLKAADPHRVPK
jgi:four helix bundle protein